MKIRILFAALALASPAAALQYPNEHFGGLTLDAPLAVISGGIGNSTGNIAGLNFGGVALSGNLCLLNASCTWTGSQTFTGGGDGSALAVLSGTVARSLSARFSGVVNAADYGVVCDYVPGGGTDNTTALANAISAAQTNSQFGGKKLVLPAGRCLTGPQTITGQIFIEGQGAFASQLVLKSGSTTPLLSFVNAYSPDFTGASDALTYGREFGITSVDGYTGWNAINDASGIKIAPTATGSTWFYFENINVYNMPNNGIESTTTHSFISLLNPVLNWNGAWGLLTNSTNDTAVTGAQMYQNGYGANSPNLPAKGGGWLSSGDGALFIHNINSFYNNGPGGWFYAPTNVTISGHNEYNGNVAQGIIITSATSALTQMTLDGIIFSVNSRISPGTFADFEFHDGGGKVILNNNLFAANYYAGGGSSGFNVLVDGGATPQIFCHDCFFNAGGITTYGVTNDAVHFTEFGGDGGTLAGKVAVVAGAQYTGQTWSNGTNIFAKIIGQSSTNDSGLLQLSNGGTTGVSLSGGATSSYIIPNIGFGGQTSPSYPVDVTGSIRVSGNGYFSTLSTSSSSQFAGQTWGNGTNNFAALGGSTTGNDSGYLTLLLGGVAKVNFSAGNGVYNYFIPNVGFGGQTSPAYPVDVTGQVNATTGYLVNGVVGVTCAAGTVSLSTLTVAKGIVTHC